MEFIWFELNYFFEFFKKILIEVNLDNKETVYTKYYEGQDGGFSMINAEFFLRRRTLFYSFNFILPSFLITILSICGFVLSPGSEEKCVLRK